MEPNIVEQKAVARIGGKILHEGVEFIIVDIRHNQSTESMDLYIHAVDPKSAEKDQIEGIQLDQTKEKVQELVKKMPDVIKDLLKGLQ